MIKITKVILPIFMFAVITHGVFAQAVSVVKSDTALSAGDSFVVELRLNTDGQKINAAEGILKTSDNLSIEGTRYGDSILSLWPATPRVSDKKKVLSFTGGVPGGYSGSNGLLLSFLVRANAAGDSFVSINNISLFLHDGAGTSLEGTKKNSLYFSVSEKKAGEPIKEASLSLGEDTLGPEMAKTIVSKDESVFEGNYFVAFSAADKHSGVDYFDVIEEPFLIKYLTYFNKETKQAKSPVLLVYQYWPSKVTVSVYDQANNKSQASVRKPHDVYVLATLLFSVLLLFSVVILKKGKYK
ncbi:MAG: hypothetical protein A3H57_03580 [Candidatus Taylorbacteria bacterium RIFCSPLOWO2_02_FULL_43_11]|uniref:Cohesin domain-containing protein n=1 Tax=Candidatus Taylorbacteria bacterium RIFCSPHIGHO2_02_FULL_43_32b TaxID=1802306 RepID=A0A1G2MKC8_9BACT|nr:MAG: hypothetical protein A3C72_02235 [Candidatus Taylorbacteria bacterium RIFCSPHIGHO2_02_FULL_43_32b]OHA31714.1 MAG: hypothetical protein A3B08_01960 [Candidatus Taylorbacteria bacterium RIFCSPLOWO2_01_FULL_43_44]OHA36627.1 MAG: hypothetical protein A3H57_03580 [Candidatus Taylorbacteria bacterium RIFCSPLOWO2_02_FULL_43_11]